MRTIVLLLLLSVFVVHAQCPPGTYSYDYYDSGGNYIASLCIRDGDTPAQGIYIYTNGLSGGYTSHPEIFVPGPGDLWLQMESFSVQSIQPLAYNVSLSYHGLVTNSVYQVFINSSLTTTNWNYFESFIAPAADFTNSFTITYRLQAGSYLTNAFFRIYGQHQAVVKDETLSGHLLSFSAGLFLSLVIKRSML